MPNGFENFADAAMQLGQRWHQERQQARLANALSTYSTDPLGAATAATKIDPVLGVNLTNQVKANALAQQNADGERAHAALGDLITYLRPAAQDPNATPESLGKAYDSLTPLMSSALRMKPSEIAQWRQTFISNPGMLDDLAARAKDIQAGAPGTVFFDKRSQRPVYAVPQPDKVLTVGSDATGRQVVTVPQTYGGQSTAIPSGGGAAAQPTAPAAAPGVPPPGSPEREALYRAVGLQESSGEAGAVGPQTKYGRAIGNMQTMPSTAQEMAMKLGMAWRPDLLKGTDAQSAAYQTALGRAYFDEGLDKTGNVADALHYYYGGPNQRQWGPKTKAYPGQVASRMDPQLAQQFGLVPGAPIQTQAGRFAAASDASGAPAPAAPGARTVFTAPAKPAAADKGWRQLTPDEVQAKGLDGRATWQVGVGGTHDGEIKLIGPASQMKAPTTTSADNAARFDTIISGLEQLRDQATALQSHPGLDRDVGWMGYFPNIKGSHATDFHNQLQSLRANTALGVLNNLRAASKTGGGIGRVTNMEIGLFQNSLGSLDESQSPEAFKGNLGNVVKYANDAIARYQNLKTKSLAAPTPAGPTSPAPQGGGNASSGIDPRAIDILKKNPTKLYRQRFDETFGSGSAQRILGN